MKKLSLRDNYSYQQSYKLDFHPGAILYTDGFSGFEVHREKVRGTCVKCVQQYCRQYQRSELYSTRFSTFPKNSSPRVCPVDAISVGSDGYSTIDAKKCISCGLCLHRCPFAAIQFNPSKTECWINHDDTHLTESFSQQDLLDQVNELRSLNKTVRFSKISYHVANKFSDTLSDSAIKDISEIIVRNALTNIGCKCNTKAPGNNHNRIEFFAESHNQIIIGESASKNQDTLSITRRILDDLAVLSSRHKIQLNDIVPLAVINGLPNKRTDYYEVIEDIENVLGIRVSTITYHILLILNLYNIPINANSISSFYLNRRQDSLLNSMKRLIPEIASLDQNINDSYYTPVK